MFASSPEGRLISADPRPTFVLGGAQQSVCFRNEAFDRFAISAACGDVESKCFDRFAGYHWTRFQSGQHAIVSGSPCCGEDAVRCADHEYVKVVATTTAAAMTENEANFRALRRLIGNCVTPSMNELLKLMETKDWSSSNLGLWPPELLEIMRIILSVPGNKNPMALALGRKHILFYNEGYAKFLGARHPSVLALPLDDAWPEWAPAREELHATLEAKGVYSVDEPIYFRDGFDDRPGPERWATWSSIAFPTYQNSILILPSDCTDAVLEHRRRGVLDVLKEKCANLESFSSFSQAASNICVEYPKDIPFMLVYSCQHNDDQKNVVLETAFPDQETVVSTPHISQTLQEAVCSSSSIVLMGDSMPIEWQNLACKHGFLEKARTGVILALRSSPERKDVYGVIVLGVNPQRPLDAQHRSFVDGLLQDISAFALASHQREKSVQEIWSNNQQIESFGRLIDLTDVGLFEFSASGKLIKANDAYYKLSGYPRIPESAQTPFMFRDLIVPEDMDTADAFWSQLMEHGRSSSCEFRYRYTHPDLTEEEEDLGGKWVMSSCLPLLDTDGKPYAITGCNIDATAQKRSNLSLTKRTRVLEIAKDNEERFKAFAQESPAGIYIFNTQRQLVYSNPTFLRMMGAPEDQDLTDFVYADHVHEDDLAEVGEAFARVMQEGNPIVHEFRLKRSWTSSDGVESEAWVKAVSFAVLDEDGIVKNGQGLLFDISSLKWAEALERSLKELAIESKTRQQAFNDMTSHELRNPLSAVIQCTDIVLDSLQQILLHARNMFGSSPEQAESALAKLDKEVKSSLESMRTIDTCSGHSMRIISDILELSKLDARSLEIAPTTVRFTEAMTSCIDIYRRVAQAKELQLELQIDDSLNELGVDWVSIDTSRVQQIIMNMLTNAIKFSTPDEDSTPNVIIRVGASAEPPKCFNNVIFNPKNHDAKLADPTDIWLCCSVTDSGLGLSQNQQNILFQRFSQAHAPKTFSKYGGSGLGLFLSRSLSELQGGEIGVFSAGEGSGSTFAFYIKSTRVAPVPADDIDIPHCDRPSAIRKLSLSNSISVLVVEDNVLNSKVLTQQLKKRNYEVHTAYDGGEALEFIKTTNHWRDNREGPSISVILMDAEMPVLNGIDCTHAIRQFEHDGQITSHIPIIAVSANARREQIEEMLEAGMDDSISKPFRIADLVPKIQRLMRRSNLSK